MSLLLDPLMGTPSNEFQACVQFLEDEGMADWVEYVLCYHRDRYPMVSLHILKAIHSVLTF